MSGGAKDEMKVSRDVMVALKEVKENQKKREEFGMCGCGQRGKRDNFEIWECNSVSMCLPI